MANNKTGLGRGHRVVVKLPMSKIRIGICYPGCPRTSRKPVGLGCWNPVYQVDPSAYEQISETCILPGRTENGADYGPLGLDSDIPTGKNYWKYLAILLGLNLRR